MIKGMACATIVWHHLAFYGPMSDIAHPLAPALMAWLYDYGRMAVQVFLVLGGYLAAASLAPQGVARFDHAGTAIAKRFVRLVVPYAVALVLAVLVSALVRPWMDHHSVPDQPTFSQLLANALLLQDIVGAGALSAGVWYVAIDLQLYAALLLWLTLVAALLKGSGQMRLVLPWGVVMAVVWSAWCVNRDSTWDTGYCRSFTVRNAGTSEVASWRLGFTLPADAAIRDSWNGTIARSGNQVTVTPAAWASRIAPGASVSAFGFCAAGTTEPAGVVATTP